jgi:DNA-binding transcriptional LysR family regulator
MELRHLRYFVAVGEEQHYGRAAQRLSIAQPALSRQIQSLEREIGFELFERLPRGVRITAAGKLFLDDARRILKEVGDATSRAKRIASGQSGTLRIGFVQSMSWHGIVPDSFRHFRELQPDPELQLKPASSSDQLTAIHSGSLDAGFVFAPPTADRDLAELQIGFVNIVLALPAGHALTKLEKLRLRDLIDTPFVWFPRRVSPAFFDHLMAKCSRGGLTAPRVIQEAADEVVILSLVACRVGVAFVSNASRWRLPPGVELRPVTDLDARVPFALVWRKDNNSPILAKFTTDVRSMVVQNGRKHPFLANL